MAAPAVRIRGLVKAFGDGGEHDHVRAVDHVDLDVEEGEFFALLGPSGCGKTTTLRIVAGFEEPDAGEVWLGGRSLSGVPAFHRPVNTVFQDYALFPHMTVAQNVGFGLRMARVPRSEARQRVDEALELVRLESAAQRRPDQLSGGQRQRVALARALVNRPRVLLLDEPLGALDLKLRKAMQLELTQLQQRIGITFVYVTHDQEEALTMADRIAVMSDGRVLQVGTPEEIYERPSERFVADFIGDGNFVDGTVADVRGGVGRLEVGGGIVLEGVVRSADLVAGRRATFAIRPERLVVRDRAPGSATVSPQAIVTSEAAETCVEAIVGEVHYLGTDMKYRLDGPFGSLTARVQNGRGPLTDRRAVGDVVTVSWAREDASLLP